jgi:hypothetical protein
VPRVKVLKPLAMVLLALVGGFAAIGVVLPRDMKVERSLVLKATRADAYETVVDVDSWQRWILGPSLDPRCTFSPERNRLLWNCEGAQGSLLIADADPQKAVWIDIAMPGAIPMAKVKVVLEDVVEGTKVSWTEQARAPGLVGGWLTPLFRRARGEQIELALKQLAAEVSR